MSDVLPFRPRTTSRRRDVPGHPAHHYVTFRERAGWFAACLRWGRCCASWGPYSTRHEAVAIALELGRRADAVFDGTVGIEWKRRRA